MRMTEIFAHRANLDGPKPASENFIGSVRRALELGFGIETDLRRAPVNGFYISHDAEPWSTSNSLANFAQFFRKYADRPIAMNVKELGYEEQLITLQRSGDLGNRSFYFVFDLLEPKTPGRTQRLIKGLPGGEGISMAWQLTDRGERSGQGLSI